MKRLLCILLAAALLVGCVLLLLPDDCLPETLRREAEKPRVIIAKTVKGKGVSFAENEVTWHTGRLTDELYQEAIRELND